MFTKVVESIENEGTRAYSLALLDKIALNPKPIYKASEKGLTTRIFSSNSYLNLPRNIREIFLQDCIKIDIKSSQFNIVSRLWDIKPVVEFLDNGGHLWTTLYKYMEWEDFDEATKELLKACLKRFTYSCLYGMGKGSLKSNFRKEVQEIIPKLTAHTTKVNKLGVVRKESVGDYLCKHPLFKAIFTRRDSILKKIKREGGIESLKGWMPLEDNTPQSLLACVAQQVEMEAMQPIAELMCHEAEACKKRSNKQNQFMCMGWLHDGVYIELGDKANTTHMWLERIKAISNNLKEQTGLEYEVDVPYEYKVFEDRKVRTAKRSNGKFLSKPVYQIKDKKDIDKNIKDIGKDLDKKDIKKKE